MRRTKLLLAGGVCAGALLMPAGAHALTISSKGPGKVPTVSGTLKTGYQTLTFTSSAKAEVDYTLVKLKRGVSVADARRIAKRSSNPTVIQDRVGSFVTGAGLQGSDSTVTIKATKGTYVLADATGKPKLVKVLKTRGKATGGAPKADATVDMHDFMIMPMGDGLPAGKGIVKVVNRGPSPHFIVAINAPDAATAKTIAADLEAGKDEAAQKLASGFSELASLLSPGVTNYVHTDLKAGPLVLACFYGDKRSKGKEHSRLGMVDVTTVG